MNSIKLTASEFKKILEDAYGVIIDDREYYIDDNYELFEANIVTAFVQYDNDSNITDAIIIPIEVEQNNNVIYNPIFRTFTYENSNIPSFRILKVFTL